MPHKRTGRIADTAAMNAFGTAPDVYPTGLYLRISGEEAAKGEKLNNQRDLLLSFVKTKTELKIVDIYSDNGETGTNFDRPEWNRLMEDVKKETYLMYCGKRLVTFWKELYRNRKLP